jgi:hypothetical protein
MSPRHYERPPRPIGISGLTAAAQGTDRIDRSFARGLAAVNLDAEPSEPETPSLDYLIAMQRSQSSGRA